MVNTFELQNLKVTRIFPRQEGIFVYATYDHWTYQYKFLIQSDGVVKGETSRGLWLELEPELSAFVRENVKATLREKAYLVYA
jgi:hypothetical protein